MAATHETLGVAQNENINTPFGVMPKQEVIRCLNRGNQSTHLTTKQTIGWMIRQFVLQMLYPVLLNIYGLYVRLRFIYRSILYRFQTVMNYHHHTPSIIQRDVAGLEKLPKHFSVILPSPPTSPRHRRINVKYAGMALEKLLNDAGDITAWCASAGIENVSIYEKTGVLKQSIPSTYSAIMLKLSQYFPASSIPHLTIRAPNVPSYSPRPSSAGSPESSGATTPAVARINVLLISAEDGRETIVDLTKTFAGMVQKNILTPSDIRVDLVELEMQESIMDEPDLLLCALEECHLDGYPPWHLRLCEIFHLPDHSPGVTYNLFLKSLQMFGMSTARFGK